jgi:hypothetical protein
MKFCRSLLCYIDQKFKITKLGSAEVHFGSWNQKFFVVNNFSGIINCGTFSVAPSSINDYLYREDLLKGKHQYG